MAVLASAAARGWRLADVRAAVASGAWKGLPELYERRLGTGPARTAPAAGVAKMRRLRDRGEKRTLMAH